jgi:hypothetical protein
VRFPGQAGTGGLRAVAGPQLAAVPYPDQPAPLRLQPCRLATQGDHGVGRGGVVEGIDVDGGELVEHRFESFEEPLNHHLILSNICS